ncbi:MAG: sigma-54-dependent Fis family transcriptional regulator, partial [Verrucomicrobia bacterium]|nr:sigma-54-dependent Fis family transcriptional regulator [Verrucomicrobiota bacterium]
WRLRVVTIHMPPLRTRKGDIPVLVDHFLKELSAANGKAFKALGEDALAPLMNYDWPGNVRELRAAIEHGVVMSNSGRIMAKHLPAYLSQPGGLGWRVPGKAQSNDEAISKAPLDIHQAEKQLILEALERSGNNRSEAAELLNMSRRSLQRKLKEMGMVRKHRMRVKAGK